jgi:WD40-like Beta Propeller Repeat
MLKTIKSLISLGAVAFVSIQAINPNPTPANLPFYTSTIKNESVVNGENDDFSPAWYQNGIVFCSNSLTGKKTATEADDLNLKFAEFDANGNLMKSKMFSRKINTKTNEGPAAFAADGNTMYFTRTTSKGGIEKVNKQGVHTLKIYIKTKDDKGDWSKDMILPFEKDEYSFCHPSLSADGQRMYFSSDLAGGKGGYDIYYVRKMTDGTWSNPINLEKVNSPKNEVFPYVHNDGMFYFASNGHNSVGGLDIFKFDPTQRTSVPVNLGSPINSASDDFGLIINSTNLGGFFSSNREGSKGGDDIYSFKFKQN